MLTDIDPIAEINAWGTGQRFHIVSHWRRIQRSLRIEAQYESL